MQDEDVTRDKNNERERRYQAAQARQAELLARPDIQAVSARVAALTGKERQQLHDAWRANFRLYRPGQSTLSHRCGKAYSEQMGDPYGYRDVLRVADEVSGFGGYDGDDWGRHHAVADYVKVLLWGDLLAEHERAVFAGPWLQVIGPVTVVADRVVSDWAAV